MTADWWMIYGNISPTLKNLAMRILAQTSSSSACEQNWSTFALIHIKQRNRLAYARLEQLVFCYYNMKLMLRDMEAKKAGLIHQDLLDLLLITAEESEDDPLFKWIRPSHMDDQDGSPLPDIAVHAQELGINVDQVMVEEVGSSSSLFTNDFMSKISFNDDNGSGGGGYSGTGGD